MFINIIATHHPQMHVAQSALIKIYVCTRFLQLSSSYEIYIIIVISLVNKNVKTVNKIPFSKCVILPINFLHPNVLVTYPKMVSKFCMLSLLR